MRSEIALRPGQNERWLNELGNADAKAGKVEPRRTQKPVKHTPS